MKIEDSKKELENLHDYAQMGCTPYNTGDKKIINEFKETLEEKDRKLKKCYEIMGEEINHCPKDFDCICEDWMYLGGHKRDCSKCWENYLDRLTKQGKL